jgi:hypothetical protein
LLHQTTDMPLTLTRTAQPAGRVAGHGIALHAHPAHINALVDLLCVVGRIVLGDAHALLGSIVDVLRTGRHTGRKGYQANQTSQSHGTLSSTGGTTVTSLPVPMIFPKCVTGAR